MLLLIDNYDSFTFNLVHAFEILGSQVAVIRNNAKTLEQCIQLRPSSIVVGPGPGNPSHAGISNAMIKTCEGKIPVLGVCLGHQCIAEVYGGKIVRARSGPMHGKISRIVHQGEGVFQGLNSGFCATRYHSLAVDAETLPSCLTVTAKSEDGEIMGLRHKQYPIEGVQFHPESVLTELGMEIFKNFLIQSKELL